ncbi:hypothetical protein [Salana multivorans]
MTRSQTWRTTSGGYQVTLRDCAAWWLATQALRLASPPYRAWLYIAYTLGQEEVERRIERSIDDD